MELALKRWHPEAYVQAVKPMVGIGVDVEWYEVYMDAREFLTKLWGDPPPGQVLVWTLPQKRSTWYNRLDVYTGVGVAPMDALLRSSQRAVADAIAGIAGMWSDVDYAGKNHAKPRLPQTEEEALELVAAMPVRPTILVHSGHGLQAWWLFKKPWMFQNGEREEAQALIRDWQGHMARLAKRRGWVVDSTHDLARVMRLPGTVNNKAEPVPVRVIWSDGPRIDRDEARLYIDAASPEVVLRPEAQDRPAIDADGTGELVLDPAAEPPFEKFLALMENDAKWKRSWERRRSDLSDQSASSYDLSLASIAVSVGWTDQEIANLIIANRRRHGDDLKLREDYYRRTITKARPERLEAGGSLADLSIIVGVEILDLVRYLGDPSEYWMRTTDGAITLGGINNITDQGRFRNAVADSTRILLPPCHRMEWAKRAQAILLCCRDVELGEASHPGTGMTEMVETYLTGQTILDDQNVAAEQGFPFRRDGAVLFPLGEFRQYLRFAKSETLSAHKLGQRLRMCGIEPVVVYVVIEGRTTSRNYWRMTYRDQPTEGHLGCGL